MLPSFLVRSLVAGLIAAVVASIAGIYVILRKLSFFTHAISHGSLTGVAIGFLVGINPFLMALVTGCGIGCLIAFTMERTKLHADAIVGTLLPASMSVGLIIISFIKGYKPDLMSYLFGDILSVTTGDIVAMSIIGLVCIGFIAVFFTRITVLSIDEEWARLKGINTRAMNYLFLVLLSLVVITGARVVGIILVSALVVIPSASSANIARNLNQMFAYSIGIAVFGVLGGVLVSYMIDIPSGPSIIVILSLIFLTTMILRRKK